VKVQGKLNRHVILETADAVCQKLSKFIFAVQNHSLPKLAHYLRYSVIKASLWKSALAASISLSLSVLTAIFQVNLG